MLKYPGSKASYSKWIMSLFPSHKHLCKFSEFKKYGKSTANAESMAKCRKNKYDKSTANAESTAKCRKKKYGKSTTNPKSMAKSFYNRLRGGG